MSPRLGSSGLVWSRVASLQGLELASRQVWPAGLAWASLQVDKLAGASRRRPRTKGSRRLRAISARRLMIIGK